MKLQKFDLLKEYKSCYKAGRKPQIVEFGEVNYLAIEGKGVPAGEIFPRKVEAMYQPAYCMTRRLI